MQSRRLVGLHTVASDSGYCLVFVFEPESYCLGLVLGLNLMVFRY